jgi:uncharacterized repeat protein (TIGR03803 family)
VLHAFGKGKDGAGLWGSLTLDKKGNLYGTTSGGGAHNFGTVFELMPHPGGLWTEAILHSFCSLPHCADGSEPFSDVILDERGNLYGTTTFEVFEMAPGTIGWTLRVLDNNGSRAGLLLDKAGNLYGNIGPGKYGDGAVTELVRGSNGWTESVLYSFCSKLYCADGATPIAGVTFGKAGNLYGTTEYGGHSTYCHGGAIGCGVVFNLTPSQDGSRGERVLHIFPSNANDGSLPLGGLILDTSGNLYGTTLQGGGNGCGEGTGCGTVYKLTPTAKGWKETVLYNFANPKNGAGPSSSLTFDAFGNLWGTAGGGTGQCNGGCGVVFKMTPASDGKWTYSVVHQFTGNDGAYPNASVVFDGKGNLYGTTTLGGAGGYGVVFEITP